MTNDEIPRGQRFSHVYIARGTPTPDSQRFRRRVAAYFVQNCERVRQRVTEAINAELGIDVPWRGVYNYQDYFGSAAVHDVLDTITLVWRELARRGDSQGCTNWRDFVQRALNEENVGYRLDESAGVHYFVDEEFERNRVATIERLANSRYAAVLSEFESAHQKLDEHPADTKGAVRAVFEAVEILSKLMVGENRMQRLTTHEINNHLWPIVESAYEGEAVALEAATKFFGGLIGWVRSIHEYRHGQEVEEPTPPPLGLAVAMVSSGATYLRWLAELDQSGGS